MFILCSVRENHLVMVHFLFSGSSFVHMQKEVFAMYKSQLQEYAQKAGLIAPTYEHVKEGASHEPRFKSTVWVNSQKYDSAPGFLTVRAAEHAAAKVALDYLQKNQTSGITPSAVVSHLFLFLHLYSSCFNISLILTAVPLFVRKFAPESSI